MATLLVVDDEPDMRDLLVRRLMRAGHRVVAADGGPAALTLANSCLVWTLTGYEEVEVHEQVKVEK